MRSVDARGLQYAFLGDVAGDDGYTQASGQGQSAGLRVALDAHHGDLQFPQAGAQVYEGVEVREVCEPGRHVVDQEVVACSHRPYDRLDCLPYRGRQSRRARRALTGHRSGLRGTSSRTGRVPRAGRRGMGPACALCGHGPCSALPRGYTVGRWQISGPARRGGAKAVSAARAGPDLRLGTVICGARGCDLPRAARHVSRNVTL